MTSCISLAPGSSTWTSHSTIQSRWGHVSWLATGKLYLIGGIGTSSEIVGAGAGFTIQRPT